MTKKKMDELVDEIVTVLDGNAWDADACDTIATILRNAGYVIRDIDGLGEGKAERLSDEALCDKVGAALGDGAEGIYTGGGIYCVLIPEPLYPGTQWICGMGGDQWGCTLEDKVNGGPADVTIGSKDAITSVEAAADSDVYMWTTVESESQDAAAIAKALKAAQDKWQREQLDRVAVEVTKKLVDLKATYEYPGFIAIPVGATTYAAIGTASGEDWGGNLSDGDGSDGPAFGLTDADGKDISSDCTDVTHIADAIRREIARLKGAQ